MKKTDDIAQSNSQERFNEWWYHYDGKLSRDEVIALHAWQESESHWQKRVEEAEDVLDDVIV